MDNNKTNAVTPDKAGNSPTHKTDVEKKETTSTTEQTITSTTPVAPKKTTDTPEANDGKDETVTDTDTTSKK